MEDTFILNRFIDAQSNTYENALNEIKSGRKTSHWMWFIFPQYHGLGASSTAIKYAISSKQEAISYFKHPILGSRLLEITKAFLSIENKTAYHILGKPDDLKLKSSMTLFAAIQSETDVFNSVLEKYAIENKNHAIRMENQLDTVQETLNVTENQLDDVKGELGDVKEKLGDVKETLDIAVKAVVEKRKNGDDQNYLCVLKLKEAYIRNGVYYDYYVIRCTGLKDLKRLKSEISYKTVICCFGPNNAISSWRIIRERLKKDKKMSSYRNYFFIKTKNKVPRIKERDISDTFQKILFNNRKRITEK